MYPFTIPFPEVFGSCRLSGGPVGRFLCQWLMTVERPISITSLRFPKVCSCLVYFCTNHICWPLKCMHFLCTAGCFGGQMRIGLQIHDSLPLKHKNLFLGQKSLPKFKTEENTLETWFNPMFTLPLNHLLPAHATGNGAEPSLSTLYVKGSIERIPLGPEE